MSLSYFFHVFQVSMEATVGSRTNSRGPVFDMKKIREVSLLAVVDVLHQSTWELSPLQEPAVIREWREKQVERLRLKDEEEEEARAQLKVQAAKVRKVGAGRGWLGFLGCSGLSRRSG